MVLNAQEKLKEKVLEKIIAQEQFSDGFKSLRKFFIESQENGAIKEFVSSSLISDFKNLKKTRSKNGTKNVPFIEKTKELIGYDISDFMIYILTEKGPNENVVSEYLISNHLQRVRDCKGSHHDAEMKNSQIVFDYVKKTFELKNFNVVNNKKPQIDDLSFKEAFSKDTYYVQNLRKLFLMFVTENNNKITFVKNNPNIHFRPNVKDLFFYNGKTITNYKGDVLTRDDFLGEALDYHFGIFLWQFYKNLEKFHKNNLDSLKIYLGLNQKKLTTEIGTDDDYILISKIDKLSPEYRKVLADYIWKGRDIESLEDFFIKKIASDFEELLSKILESDYSLNNVLNKEVPLSILSDYQIAESMTSPLGGFTNINLNYLKKIKDNCHDPKQFSRLMNLIEEHL